MHRKPVRVVQNGDVIDEEAALGRNRPAGGLRKGKLRWVHRSHVRDAVVASWCALAFGLARPPSRISHDLAVQDAPLSLSAVVTGVDDGVRRRPNAER